MSLELLARTYKMIECLTEAGRKIQAQNIEIQQLKEENEKLHNGDYVINITPQIGAFKERIKQLEWELDAWRNSKKVQLPREVAAELDVLIIKGISNAAIAKRFFTASNVDKELLGVSELLEWTEHGRTELGKTRVTIFLSALVNGYTEEPEPEKDEAASLRNEVQTLVSEWWVGDSSTKESLIGTFYDYIKQREDDKLPF